MLKAVDLDGDGGDDLAILDAGSDDPIRVRLATEESKLGPEQRFPVEAPKCDRLRADRRPGRVRAVDHRGPSGRAKVLTLEDAGEDEPGKRGRLSSLRCRRAMSAADRCRWTTSTATGRPTSW